MAAVSPKGSIGHCLNDIYRLYLIQKGIRRLLERFKFNKPLAELFNPLVDKKTKISSKYE